MPASAYALLAFGIWGLVPAFWKQLLAFPALELIVYRVFFSVIFLLIIQALRSSGRWHWPRYSARIYGWLGISGFLIGSNWFLYVWAVNSGHIIESSLGYFITPLLNIVLGTLLLGERMTKRQKFACAWATVGVVVLIINKGIFPWISLFLALSFSFYGLVRKIAHVPTISGTTLETLFLLPAGALILVYMEHYGKLHISGASTRDIFFLAGIGPVTTIPLLAFARAARSLPLSVLGFFQFLSPSLQFLQGLLLYHEPFSAGDFLAFLLIWIGLAIFLFDLRFSPAKK